MEKKNAWEKYPEGTKRQDVFTFAEEYRKFISSCKTERECAAEFYRQAKEAGFTDLSEKIAQNAKLKAGDAAQQDTGNDIERAFNAKSDTKTIRTAQNRRHGQKHTAFLFTVPFYIKQARFA